MIRSLRWSSLVLGLLLTACPASTPDLCDNGACDGTDGSDGSADSVSDTLPDVEGCDLSLDPKDSPKCIVDAAGVFVDATNGLDSNDGSKAKPVQTIGSALAKAAGKPRVYVCEGTYAEDVLVDAAHPVSLVGGLKCGDWSYTGVRPVIGMGTRALTVASVTKGILIADVEFGSAMATVAGESSIAAFVHDAASVTFLRAKLSAAAGKDGAVGSTGSNWTNVDPSDPTIAGNDAVNAQGGGLHTCALCKDTKNSTGGGGGNGTAVPTGGQGGSPVIPENPTAQIPPHNGAGGTAGAVCTNGNPGANASNAPAALGAATSGDLSATGWSPSSGSSGTAAGPAQGGGGGGGGISASKGGAGGGGCGGCGGAAGSAGIGGGGSLALVSVGSTVTLTACELTTSAAGKGGDGAAGQAGQVGGYGGAQSIPGCPGGQGGSGGAGGSGGGGAGGLSVAVLWKGTAAPTIDSSTTAKITVAATGGAKGVGGATPTNDGITGVAQAVLEVK